MDGTIIYEYEKNLHKFRDRAEKRSIALKRAAAGAGIALSLLFGWKSLKAEGIMVPNGAASSESSSAVSVSLEQSEPQPMRDSPSSEIGESTETEKAEIRPESPRQPKQIAIQGMCELSEAEFEKERLDGEKVYACLFDSDEDNAMSALSAVGRNSYKRDLNLENKIVLRVIQILEARDEYGFLHSSAARAVMKKRMHRAIPALIKSFGTMNYSAKEDAVEALGMFARENDWNSINMLIRLLKDEDEGTRAHAMANLVFVNKNVMDAVKIQLRAENQEMRSVFCRNLIYLYVETESYLSPGDSELLFSRISEIKKGEKSKDVLKCLEFFDEEFRFLSIRHRQ